MQYIMNQKQKNLLGGNKMKYVLEVKFETDDFDSEESEVVEDIRHEIEDIITNYSLTDKPKVKIREE